MTYIGRSLPLVAVCAVALGLRLIGLQYGLPAVYNPDEVAIMSRALSFATGTLNPHNFLYPTFYFYVLFAWVGVYLALVWVTGRVDSIAALRRLTFWTPRASTRLAVRWGSPPAQRPWRCCTGSRRS